MAISLTPPAIKTILQSVGYNDIQNIPPVGGPVEGFNILLKSKDINWRKNVTPYFKPFGFQVGDITQEGEAHHWEEDYIEVSGYKIFARLKKDKVIHPSLSYGRENEHNLFVAISEYLNEYKKINIEFQVNGRTDLLCKNVVKIEQSGKNVSDRKKSDILLYETHGHTYPISLKQLDASGWESPETYFGEKSRNMMEYALANFSDKVEVKLGKEGIYSLSKEIALEVTPEEAKDLVFGNDIQPNGAVIKQTWQSGHFDWDFIFRTLTIECKNVVRHLSDIPVEDWPYFQIRNFANKNPKFLVKGIGILAVTKLSARNNVILPYRARYYDEWKRSKLTA